MTDASALCIGGTRFIGRHTVEELLAAGYRVTVLTRGESGNPFEDRESVEHVTGDRTDREALERARNTAEPDIVIDLCAYFPADVERATDVFADVDGYVYVSSGSVYDGPDVPLREENTPLHDCSAVQATDESMTTYGPRKAEGDRIVFEAAESGVNAVAVRPMLVYGPHDYTGRFAYWVNRVAEYDRVLVPGDGGSLLHRAYVEDVARALRIAAEEGKPGQAYNVADRNTFSLGRSLELVAEALETDIEIVTASERELAAHDLEPTDFPLYVASPAIASTQKLHSLGWESTSPTEAVGVTARAHVEAGRTGRDNGPERPAEERVIESLSE
jgi:2'-hydroxyisoflavone reductase